MVPQLGLAVDAAGRVPKPRRRNIDRSHCDEEVGLMGIVHVCVVACMWAMPGRGQDRFSRNDKTRRMPIATVPTACGAVAIQLLPWVQDSATSPRGRMSMMVRNSGSALRCQRRSPSATRPSTPSRRPAAVTQARSVDAGTP